MTELSKYCKALIKKTIHLAHFVVKDSEAKNVHQLRVEIKKLKAFIHMMFFSDQEMNDELLKKLKKIFRGIGTIRDRQVLMEKIKESKSVDDGVKDEVMKLLQREENESHKKFKKHFDNSGHHELKEAEGVLLKAIDHSTETALSNYFNSMISDALHKSRRNNLSDTEYHELRKQLKELKYNLKQFPDEFKKNLDQIPDEKELNKLEKMLGQWHDQVVMAQLLDHAASNDELSSGAVENLHQMKSEAEETGRRLLLKVQSYFQRHEIVFH